MTYGVDQCRVCGTSIRPSDSEAMDRYRASLSAKPTMSEKEWRRAGFKAMPTRRQMMHKLDGMCFDCRLKFGVRQVPLLPMLVPLVAFILAVVVAIFYLASAFT